VVRVLNFGPLWQRAPSIGGHGVQLIRLFLALWHQKNIRVKLNNGLLTNENEETDTLKAGGSRFRGLAHVLDRSARMPSLAHVPGDAHPWTR